MPGTISPGQVNGDDSTGPDRSSSPSISPRAAAEGRRVEIGEDRGSPGENHGVGGGCEGVGWYDHFAPLDAEIAQGYLQGGRCRKLMPTAWATPTYSENARSKRSRNCPCVSLPPARMARKSLEETFDVPRRKGSDCPCRSCESSIFPVLTSQPPGRSPRCHRHGSQNPGSGIRPSRENCFDRLQPTSI